MINLDKPAKVFSAKKVGRPRLTKDKKTVCLYISMDKRSVKRVTKICEILGTTRSGYVRELIIKDIKKRMRVDKKEQKNG